MYVIKYNFYGLYFSSKLKGDIIPCYHSSVGLNYCCVFSCYSFCSPGYIGQLHVVCLLSKPHLFTCLWKKSFLYTKNDLALICCSCKSQTDLSSKKKKCYRIFTLPLNPAHWNAGLVWLSHLCEERKTEWQWMQKLRFLAKVKEIWWYKCRSSMYAGTQCSGVLALTLPQELFPLNYAFRKAVGDTRQQYYTCICLPFFLTNHSVCFGKWFWPDVFNSSSCSSSRGDRTECEGWTKSVKGSRCYLHLARSWKRRLHICFVTE